LSYGRNSKGLRLILWTQPELIIRKRLSSCKHQTHLPCRPHATWAEWNLFHSEQLAAKDHNHT